MPRPRRLAADLIPVRAVKATAVGAVRSPPVSPSRAYRYPTSPEAGGTTWQAVAASGKGLAGASGLSRVRFVRGGFLAAPPSPTAGSGRMAIPTGPALPPTRGRLTQLPGVGSSDAQPGKKRCLSLRHLFLRASS